MEILPVKIYIYIYINKHICIHIYVGTSTHARLNVTELQNFSYASPD